jgi:formylmethanofuran dehydrogenase subunit D
MEAISVRLISGRTTVQGRNLDSKLSDEYRNEAARIDMHPSDMEKLSIVKDDTVAVTTQFGHVVVTAKEDEGVPEGIVFIPMGPWANAVVSGDTHGAGMPSFKGIDATLEKTAGLVLSVKELMRTYMG